MHISNDQIDIRFPWSRKIYQFNKALKATHSIKDIKACDSHTSYNWKNKSWWKEHVTLP